MYSSLYSTSVRITDDHLSVERWCIISINFSAVFRALWRVRIKERQRHPLRERAKSDNVALSRKVPGCPCRPSPQDAVSIDELNTQQLFVRSSVRHFYLVYIFIVYYNNSFHAFEM